MVEEKLINFKGVNYIVSSDGHVYSTKNIGRGNYHKEIKKRYTKDGYKQITVGNNKNRTSCRVHRLVALAFIPNPYNLPEVNHKNFIRDDNRVENLEWSTHADNVKHSTDAGKYIRYGKDNANFGKHTLHEKYKNDPRLSLEKQSRPGAQNGRSIQIRLTDCLLNTQMDFDYIRLASKYLIDNAFTEAKNIDGVSAKLSICLRSGKKYKNRFYVELID